MWKETQLGLNDWIKELGREIIVDNFAGGGGASTGIEMATGRSVDIAINHDPAAIAMHRANHPDTEHYCESVWEVDPRKAARGRKVGLCWLSPDCKHFSKAKGGKPKDKSIRGLAWVALKWAGTVKPRVIMLENVEEFMTWGPLDKDGYPIPKFKGRTFKVFCNALKYQGYTVEYKVLKACDYGAPTTRKRFFLIARCDGKPIVWPEPTHGEPKNELVKNGHIKSWRTAAEIIDWNLECPSIFDRKKPLAENTLKRIARGIERFIVNNPEPFIVSRNQDLHTPYIARIGQTGFGADRLQYELDDSLTTITTKAEHLLIAPTLVQTGYGEAEGQKPRSLDIHKPLGTVVAGGQKHAVAVANLVQYHSESEKGDVRGQGLNRPIMTLDTSNRYGLVTSHLLKMRGTNTGQKVDEPLHTITASGTHHAEVRAFLMKYYGSAENGQTVDEPLHTITTKDRFGLVTIHGTEYQIVDIGMRMLEPHELKLAQGFDKEYIIDHDHKGKAITKKEQVHKIGNSVCPPIPAALVRANLPELCNGESRRLAVS